MFTLESRVVSTICVEFRGFVYVSCFIFKFLTGSASNRGLAEHNPSHHMAGKMVTNNHSKFAEQCATTLLDDIQLANVYVYG